MSAALEDFAEVAAKPIGLGHNSGRSLREMLADQHADKLDRADKLVAAADRVPDITDDIVLGKASDLVKQQAACIKDIDKVRVSEKEPFLTAGREVDGVFSNPKDRLEKAKSAVSKKITVYLDAKAKAEREAREAEERRRAEAARMAEEARRKAEREAREAEERARRAEEEARQQRARAEQEAREREERHRREMAEAEQRARDEESKRRQSDANREKAQEEAARLRREAEDRAARERAEAEERAAREAAEAERRAEEARAESRRRAEAEEIERQRADEAEAQRVMAEKEALAKPADMARSRSDNGSMATLKRKWVFSVEDPNAVDYNQLRAYFSAEAFDKAVNAAIRNGVRPDAEGNQPLKGIRIFSINESTVR